MSKLRKIMSNRQPKATPYFELPATYDDNSLLSLSKRVDNREQQRKKCYSISEFAQLDLAKSEKWFSSLDNDADGKIYASDLLDFFQYAGVKTTEKIAEQMIKVGTHVKNSISLDDFLRINTRECLKEQLVLSKQLQQRKRLMDLLRTSPKLTDILRKPDNCAKLSMQIKQRVIKT